LKAHTDCKIRWLLLLNKGSAILEIFETIMDEYGLSPLPKNTVEAMAYIPYQQLNSKIYSPAQALEAGTAYPVLDKPFYGSKCQGGNND
jgi:hypothetical protein